MTPELDMTLTGNDLSPPSGQTDVTPDGALATSERLESSVGQWKQIIDILLCWLSDPEQLDFEEFERPREDVINSAIDFAHDHAASLAAPTAVGPSVDGGIAFEWRADDAMVEAEVIDIGCAEITEIRNGEVHEHFTLKRDPRRRGWSKTAR